MNKKVLLASLIAVVVLLAGVSISWAANNNYSAFRSFMGERASQVNEDNFNQFTQMQESMINGDYSEAQKIRTELGLGQGNRNSGGCGGCAMRNNDDGGNKKRGCSMAAEKGSKFVDENNNGICDFRENLN